MEFDTSLPFKHPSVSPIRRGLYVRDWRGTDVLPVYQRALTMDMWCPLPVGDRYWPGFWYVFEDGSIGWNDASVERLPWRTPTKAEKASFKLLYPEAMSDYRRI